MKRLFPTIAFLLWFSVSVLAQVAANDQQPTGGGLSLSPARFELEMKPGTETTVVVNLTYRSNGLANPSPARLVATLNDWNITTDGRIEYFRANSLPNSASPWLIYSPGEASVIPGNVHQIRVTISVPLNATPGDHLTALIIEQRPDSIKYEQNVRQMIVRYRMASVFYIKVPGLTQKGNFGDLLAESTPDGVVVTPTLKNEGNSMIRPVASLRIFDAEGKIVAEMPELTPLPILAGSETKQAVRIEKSLLPGNYTVKYRVDFQDGGKATEGITDLVVRAAAPQIATSGTTPKKP